MLATIFIHPARLGTNMASLSLTFGNTYSFIKSNKGNVVMLQNPKFKKPKGLVS